jgi:hypothetical protein
MSKGQKQLQQQATDRSAEQNRIGTAAANNVQNNPEVAAQRARVQGRRGYINAGDLADAKDFVSNRANTAAREQQRETKSNLLKTGVAGLASNYADPTQIALADKMNKDEFARDSAAQTESDAANYIADTENQEQGLINTELGASESVMNSAWNSSNQNMGMAAQIAASRASVMPAILGAAISGAAGIATGGNWFQRAAGAARGGGGSFNGVT